MVCFALIDSQSRNDLYVDLLIKQPRHPLQNKIWCNFMRFFLVLLRTCRISAEIICLIKKKYLNIFIKLLNILNLNQVLSQNKNCKYIRRFTLVSSHSIQTWRSTFDVENSDKTAQNTVIILVYLQFPHNVEVG